MIVRIDVSNPPGVSIVISTSAGMLLRRAINSVDHVIRKDRLDLIIDLQPHNFCGR